MLFASEVPKSTTLSCYIQFRVLAIDTIQNIFLSCVDVTIYLKLVLIIIKVHML